MSLVLPLLLILLPESVPLGPWDLYLQLTSTVRERPLVDGGGGVAVEGLKAARGARYVLLRNTELSEGVEFEGSVDPAAADHFGALADPLTRTTYEIPKPSAPGERVPIRVSLGPGETRLLRLVERHAKSSIPNRYFRQAMKNGILCPYCEVPVEGGMGRP
ncbi:MAG: hypothetical protein HUU16_01725 [Candidatus Omnitrophica bacterium]|nr:hypothetical protein [Candidatus Omnitrophota bacterium]